MSASRSATPPDGAAARHRRRPWRVTGLPRQAGSARTGFTLVELMIVMVVIGIATAAVVWTLPDPRGRLADDAARFGARVRAAHQEAIIDGRPVSVWVQPGGYGFEQQRNGRWATLDGQAFRVAQWQPGTSAAVPAGGRLRVVFDSTGLADAPADVRIVRDDQARVISIAGDGAVRIGG